MTISNQTQFFLVGFDLTPQAHIFVFVALFFVYIISLLGNFLIIVVTCLHQQLQKPMYFFLGNLAALDIFLISMTTPKLLHMLLSGNNIISLSACLFQFHFYFYLGGTEFCLLALMSLDRYLAICHPLRYAAIMTVPLCRRLIISSWVFGIVEFIPAIYLTTQLKWCNRPIFINHFFCDGSALLHVSCSDTTVAEFLIFVFASFAILGSLIPNVCSYCFILLTIISISSSNGRSKTFSTCSSHLLVILISYGSCIYIYVRPAGTNATSLQKSVAVLNSILGPCLNPFIYTLRNNMVQKSLTGMCCLKTTVILQEQ